MQHTTVTVQGYAWCPKSRTHSESVITEHANRVEAQAYIQRNKRILADLMIMQNNDRFLLDTLLAEFGHLPESVVRQWTVTVPSASGVARHLAWDVPD